MSGGSLNYLCFSEFNELFNRFDDMEYAEEFLLNNGYEDIARDVRRLIEYLKTARNRIGVLQEQLNSVFHAIEWYKSADIGEESLVKRLEEYRSKGA